MILADYITGHLGAPFKWGENDCVTFCIGWLSIRAGRDLLQPFGKWQSELGAARAIKKAGGLAAQFDANLTPIHPNLAQDGDITLIERTVWLFSGANIVTPGENGLVFKSRLEAPCAWRF